MKDWQQLLREGQLKQPEKDLLGKDLSHLKWKDNNFEHFWGERLKKPLTNGTHAPDLKTSYNLTAKANGRKTTDSPESATTDNTLLKQSYPIAEPLIVIPVVVDQRINSHPVSTNANRPVRAHRGTGRGRGNKGHDVTAELNPHLPQQNPPPAQGQPPISQDLTLHSTQDQDSRPQLPQPELKNKPASGLSPAVSKRRTTRTSSKPVRYGVFDDGGPSVRHKDNASDGDHDTADPLKDHSVSHQPTRPFSPSQSTSDQQEPSLPKRPTKRMRAGDLSVVPPLTQSAAAAPPMTDNGRKSLQWDHQQSPSNQLHPDPPSQSGRTQISRPAFPTSHHQGQSPLKQPDVSHQAYQSHETPIQIDFSSMDDLTTADTNALYDDGALKGNGERLALDLAQGHPATVPQQRSVLPAPLPNPQHTPLSTHQHTPPSVPHPTPPRRSSRPKKNRIVEIPKTLPEPHPATYFSRPRRRIFESNSSYISSVPTDRLLCMVGNQSTIPGNKDSKQEDGPSQ
ncbi:hypothetical protein DM01DRAFT_305919 [Hesseltinella vesiculosa]|uniref:Uncharacterized protein n=1 Tax=Hesseltinella vesiculosa TaxID=101127 RepID=A0A1X2GPD1_9FUNG|nr:hypothetical protein DM01DRAFT_305919 [Hesseltinella vesiculosa]